MDSQLREFCVVILLAALACGRTIRYKFLTNDDGRRELIGDSNNTAPSPDIKFLEREFDIASTTTTTVPILENHTAEDRMDHELISSSSTEYDSTTPDAYKLISKWNDYTQKGWSRQKNALYLNSTKLTIYDDGSKNKSHVYDYNELKEGRSENVTEETDKDTEVLEVIASCFEDEEQKKSGVMECLKTRILNLIMGRFDNSFKKTGKSASEKTLLHGKKLLKGALLPLLVLLVIKYLIALPVIAAGLLTIKTFWLSLLSAGVATFNAPWKKRPSFQRIDPTYETPWTSLIQQGQGTLNKGVVSGTEKYYM